MNKSLYLKKNVGPADQVIRIVFGAALVAVPALLSWSTWSSVVLAAFGGALIIEGISGY